MAPRWQAAWWPKRVRDGPTAGDEHAGKQRGGRRGRGVRCSRNATKNWPPRHHAACQRGAVFNTRNAAKHRPPRHHAACQRGAVFKTRNAPKNRPPRHHAACQRGAVFNTRNAAKHRPPRHHAACQRGAVFKTRNAPKNRPPRHHAACQRGAVFKTSGVREIGRFVALRTWPSSTHGALVLTRPAVGLDGGRNTEA